MVRKEADLSHFSVFACTAYAHVLGAKRDKLRKQHKAQICWILLKIKRTQNNEALFKGFNKRDAVFNESDFESITQRSLVSEIFVPSEEGDNQQ